MALMLVELLGTDIPSIKNMMDRRSAINEADRLIRLPVITRVIVFDRDENYPDDYYAVHRAEAPAPVQGEEG